MKCRSHLKPMQYITIMMLYLCIQYHTSETLAIDNGSTLTTCVYYTCVRLLIFVPFWALKHNIDHESMCRERCMKLHNIEYVSLHINQRYYAYLYVWPYRGQLEKQTLFRSFTELYSYFHLTHGSLNVFQLFSCKDDKYVFYVVARRRRVRNPLFM